MSVSAQQVAAPVKQQQQQQQQAAAASSKQQEQAAAGRWGDKNITKNHENIETGFYISQKKGKSSKKFKKFFLINP